MSVVSDPKELLNIINGALPNFGTFLKLLKKEKLSEDAEGFRSRYESIMLSLEQGHMPTRPVSVICDDDSGYFSANRAQAVASADTPEQHKGLPAVMQSGFLLRRDDKYRWHRCWCKSDGNEMKFFIYEDSNEDVLIRSFSLENTSVHFLPQLSLECDKESCFSVSGVVDKATEPEGATTTTLYFAAYSESEYQQWKDVMHVLTASSDPARMSVASFMDTPAGPDSASTSSSNFSSNRESMISTTSSQLCNYRNSVRGDSPPRGRVEHSTADDSKPLSVIKQQQPLPSPPQPPAEDGFDDNASEGTIYESIDNLVLQFDETIRATAEAMGQIGQNISGGKKRKKRDRSLMRQHSFFSAKHKGSKSKLLAEKKAELAKGESYSGYLLKKGRNSSWKRKWCTLKGCIFSYQKSAGDSEAHEYIALDADIQAVQEFKRPFAFRILCKGVSELCFSAEDEETLLEWLSRLNSASKTYDGGDFVSNWVNWQQDSQGYTSEPGMPETAKMRDAVTTAPRPISDASLYDIPRGNQPATLPPMDNGLYSVPRSIPVEDAPPALFSVQGMQFYTTGNPFDLYDVPRPTSMSPDEEGIYDDPFDIIDMEIYDYPPDVGDLGLQDSGLDSARNSMLTTATDFTTPDRASSAYSDDSWKTMSLPPLPNSARPSMVFSVASSDELIQGSHNSVISSDGSFYDYPRSIPLEIAESATDGTLPESSLEFGQCAMRGHLYKRERFMTWNKLFCVVRNNFLECHKPQGGTYSVPTMKLFLPGSELKEGGDSKRQWVFRVKHPRREGVLMFAAENGEEYGRWTKAFLSAASIEVQPASTVEEIRITDLEMNRRWTSLEGDLPQSTSAQATPATTPAIEDPKGTWPRRKTFSNGTNGDEYSSDTLKRRRKFSWMKSGFSRKKGEKKLHNRSQPDLDLQRLSTTNFDEPVSHNLLPPPQVDPLRKSVSLELLPTPSDGSKLPLNHQVSQSEYDQEPYQGYIRVQRKGADNMWVRYWCVVENNSISCYISQRDLTLTLAIPLQGSRISEAAFECKREHSFKVWHLESGQCLYFAADNYEEVQLWFTMVTKGAQNVLADDNTPATPFVATVFETLPTDLPSRQLSHSSEVSVTDLENSSTNAHSDAAFDGQLMKFSHNGKWKNRYCVVKQATLVVYRTSSDTDPVMSFPLPGCSLELVPEKESQQFVFTLHPWSSSKTHTFAAATDAAMFQWISVLRECLQQKPSETPGTAADNVGSQSPSNTNKSSLKKRTKAKTKESDLHVVSNVPASSLTSCDRCGFADVHFGSEPWVPHWCVVHEDCLYVYKTQTSDSTVNTIVLPGYNVQIIRSLAKKPYVVQMSHSGMSPVLLAFSDEVDLNNWLVFLEKGSRAESHKERNKAVRILSSDSIKTIASKPCKAKKGPLKADHNIRAKVIAHEDSNDSSSTSGTKLIPPIQDNIVRRYEKRIRKTRKVANQTEQSLKQHQSALLHFKKELSRHVVKLHELATSGDPHAERRLKDVRSKLLQVDKILPYLGKYVNVNRQAELQTVAVLKESCTVELHKLKSPVKASIDEQVSSDKVKAEACTESTSPVPVHIDGAHPHELQGASTAVGAENSMAQTQEEEIDNDTTLEQDVNQPSFESPYASLSEVRKPPPSSPRSDYAELSFTTMSGSPTISRPRSVNYVQVNIAALSKPSMQVASETSVQKQNLEDTLPPDIVNAEEGCTATSPDKFCEEVQSARTELLEPKAKSPPPQVAKKPVHKISDTPRTDVPQSSNAHSSFRSSRDFSPSQSDVLVVLEGSPSVMERIKALRTSSD